MSEYSEVVEKISRNALMQAMTQSHDAYGVPAKAIGEVVADRLTADDLLTLLAHKLGKQDIIINMAKRLVSEASSNNKNHRAADEATIEIALRKLTLADAAALVDHLSGGKWCAVPVELNADMFMAAHQYIDEIYKTKTTFDPRTIYATMLAAAPKPKDV